MNDQRPKRTRLNRPALTVNYALTLAIKGKPCLEAAQNPFFHGRVVATMFDDQWDSMLQAVYQQRGILLELDRRERVIRVFERGNA